MIISLVVAAARNGVIGSDNRIPWHLPDDLKYFRRITTGHHVVMGRKTFASIGKPLRDRENIVITRSRDFTATGITVVHSLDEALELARRAGETEVFVIGGGEIYRQALPIAQRLYYTRVEADVPGNTYFPEPDQQWDLREDIHHPADERHVFSFRFQRYERVGPDDFDEENHG